MNPWDVAPSEPVESTGWANFDNFENTVSMENTVIVDNKVCDESKERTLDITMDQNKIETISGNEIAVEAISTNDMKIEDSNDSSTLRIETNINHQNIEDNLHSECTADKNANPSENVDSR